MSTMPPSRSATHPSMLPPTLPTHGRARGVVFLHAVPRALCPHVEWALSAIVDTEIRLDWQPQPVSPPLLRAELPWAGRPGLGSRFMSALKGFPDLVAEVTEDPSPGREGERYALTPTLGLHRAIIGVHGDILVSEDRLRAAVAGAEATGAQLKDGIAYLLGTAWDAELEPYRAAGEDTPVRVLHHVV
ncbi:MAG: hypothetical protein RLZ94_612 [Actinomycetota bacterium]